MRIDKTQAKASRAFGLNPDSPGKNVKEGEQRLSAETLRRVVGDISDAKIAAIFRSNASLRDIEVASACAFSEDDSVSAARRTLSGKAAKVFDILTSDKADDENQQSTERTAT